MVFKDTTDDVTGLAFSPDGKYLVTSSCDGSVRLWEVATGRRYAALPVTRASSMVRLLLAGWQIRAVERC